MTGRPITGRLMAGRAMTGWSLRRWSAVTSIAAILLTIAAIGGGGVTIWHLKTARDNVVNRLDPAIRAALTLSNGLVNEETGVRGYALSARSDFLQPYTDGGVDERKAVAALRADIDDRFPLAARDLDAVVAAADAWRARYAEPTIAAVRASNVASTGTDVDRGKALFDGVRAAMSPLQTDLERLQGQARAQLNATADALTWTAIVIGAALLVGSAGLAVGLSRGLIRPLTDVGTHVRRVAAGDFEHQVRAHGPAEIRYLGTDVESMRERILTELSALREVHATLAEQAADLRRSNAELEQFAYVASHDLQEPLRKVASFCELLESRYNDLLDDRGRQYIAFAVDGATRMQALINDLLAFSRVGRLTGDHEAVDLNSVFATAAANLADSIVETGADVTIAPLPTVTGDATLLTAVAQNLIGNAIKFRRPDLVPTVEITVRAEGDDWEFTCADNGIGIDPEYADRIFVIFQRLHSKAAYAGTGIGLSLCRKIIDFHGGRVWLDTDKPAVGTRFHFTLPRQRTEERQRADQNILEGGPPS